MKNDKTNDQIKQARTNSLIYEVVRPQRKKLSYYKRRKQVGIIEKILDDPQIVDA